MSGFRSFTKDLYLIVFPNTTYHKGAYHFFYQECGEGGGGGRTTVKICGEIIFFCCLEGAITSFFVLTKFYKRVCTTHLQHVIEYD